MPAPMLEVKNIETYYGPIAAVRGVSLTIPEGSIVALLGANGAGKTTILKTISGVMEPRVGSVVFRGADITRIEPDKVMRLGISHVPEGREPFPFMSVRENLLMGAATRRQRDEVAEDIERVYAYFPVLRERASQRAGQLSGGEQQMLVIGRALVARPHMILLDEPSLGLSPKLVKEIFAIIGRINRERGTTILLVEQNAKLALETSEFAYVIENGVVAMSGDSASLRERDDVKRFYLGLGEGSPGWVHDRIKRRAWR